MKEVESHAFPDDNRDAHQVMISGLCSGNHSYEMKGRHVGYEMKELVDRHGLKVARDRKERVELLGSSI